MFRYKGYIREKSEETSLDVIGMGETNHLFLWSTGVTTKHLKLNKGSTVYRTHLVACTPVRSRGVNPPASRITNRFTRCLESVRLFRVS